MNENLSATDIGLRIKCKLDEFNLKQKDLVELTNLSKNTISNYISGNRIPDTNAIYKISKVLNTSIEWLLTGEKSSNFERTLDKEDYELLNLYSSCSSDNKKYILDSIKAYLASPNYDFKKSSDSLNEEELNILKLYRNLNTRDKIKIEGIIESKLLETDESKKGKSSTYQNGEVETSERKNA